jgi:Gpi18-like mannosyltransferase
MAWQTCRLAIDLRIAHAWVVIPVLIGQPTFFALFTDVYTEPLFALVFVLALRLHFSGRIKLGMFVASLLTLARPEGLLSLFVLGIMGFDATQNHIGENIIRPAPHIYFSFDVDSGHWRRMLVAWCADYNGGSPFYSA